MIGNMTIVRMLSVTWYITTSSVCIILYCFALIALHCIPFHCTALQCIVFCIAINWAASEFDLQKISKETYSLDSIWKCKIYVIHMLTFKCYVYRWNRMPKLLRTEWILCLNCLKKTNLSGYFHEGISLCETAKPASAEKSFLLSFTASSSWMLDDWNTSAGKQNETIKWNAPFAMVFLFFAVLGSLEYFSAVCKIQTREFLLFLSYCLKEVWRKGLWQTQRQHFCQLKMSSLQIQQDVIPTLSVIACYRTKIYA